MGKSILGSRYGIFSSGALNTSYIERDLFLCSLTLQETDALRRDMAESSAWAKAELKRRRDAKNQKNSAHGIDDGIEKSHLSNYLLCRYIFFLLIFEWE
ncbi:TPA: hypothetical protein ACPJ07_003368 [Vibrio diabolicus]|nr:hypothetical protein [Vibrio parahaemolyticus]